jgi:serine/threonine protein kinase
LHGKGIVHRDVKAENVFWRKKAVSGKNIVLGDFGLCLYLFDDLG